MNIPLSGPIKLSGDSKFPISIVHNLIQHDKMKLVRILIKTEIENVTISLSYVSTNSQEADVLTKAKLKPIVYSL